MRIDSSTIGMESARSYKASGTTITRFVIRDYQQSLQQAGTTLGGASGQQAGNLQTEGKPTTGQEETISSQPQISNLKDWHSYFGISSGKVALNRDNSGVEENLRQVTLRYIFELLFADRRNRLDEWMEEMGLTEEVSVESTLTGRNTMQGMQPGTSILSLQQETYYQEQEATEFSSAGKVLTKDGREIQFNIQVGMSRSFEQTFIGRLDLAAVQTIDPLVINLDTDVASVSDQKFFFDLDSDGQEEAISMLGSGSGFLALDKNGDGRINDGSELFGAGNGDGFKDLARYDEDRDGWIDEDDSIWSKLQIWCKDSNGQDHLYRLSEKGVGAICLDSAATEFAQKDESGELQSVIRRTGVFLYENGEVGTVQHLDLAT